MGGLLYTQQLFVSLYWHGVSEKKCMHNLGHKDQFQDEGQRVLVRHNTNHIRKSQFTPIGHGACSTMNEV